MRTEAELRVDIIRYTEIMSRCVSVKVLNWLLDEICIASSDLNWLINRGK